MLLIAAAFTMLGLPGIANAADVTSISATARFTNAVQADPGSPFLWSCGFAGATFGVCNPADPRFGPAPVLPVQIRFGDSAGGPHPSGIGFAPTTSPVTIGTPFFLGGLTHYNFPIYSGVSSVRMHIDVTARDASNAIVFTASVPWTLNIDETPNSGSCAYPSTVPCADALTFTVPGPTTIPAPGGRLYVLNFEGFEDSASGSGAPLARFISQEGARQNGFLFASLADQTVQAFARNDDFATDPGVAVSGDVRANDTDVASVSLADSADHGTLSLSPNGTFTYTPNPGFIGTDTFRYVGSSSTGYLSIAQVTILVRDNVAPVVTVPADITREATSPAGAPVPFTVTAVDVPTGPIPATCTQAPGSTFPLGETTVSCTATDPAGNSDTESFKVTVVDTTPPAISGMPAPIVAEATGPWGAPVSWVAPTASDLVSGPVAVTCSPASGSTFALGTTDVLCSAADAEGNSSSATSSVTVRDTTAPSLSGVPGNLTREATGPSGAAVTWDAPTSLDLVDGSPAVTCSPASGSTFALGTTAVTCSAADTRGNAVSQTFQVTVADTTAPAWDAEPADITREATGPAGAVATWTTPTASDAVDASVAVACDRVSGSTFALGSTTVGCTATDDAGNASATEFVVLVRDTTAPAISIPAPITVDADGAAGTVVTYAASATDTVDGSVSVTCTPASGSTFPVGVTTVTCAAVDAAGNEASRTFTVTVRGPVALATDLCSYITTGNLGPGNSLKAKCANARASIVAGYTDDACSKLQALLNEVRAQRGKSLTLAQADRITAEATRIRTILGC